MSGKNMAGDDVLLKGDVEMLEFGVATVAVSVDSLRPIV